MGKEIDTTTSDEALDSAAPSEETELVIEAAEEVELETPETQPEPEPKLGPREEQIRRMAERRRKEVLGNEAEPEPEPEPISAEAEEANEEEPDAEEVFDDQPPAIAATTETQEAEEESVDPDVDALLRNALPQPSGQPPKPAKSDPYEELRSAYSDSDPDAFIEKLKARDEALLQQATQQARLDTAGQQFQVNYPDICADTVLLNVANTRFTELYNAGVDAIQAAEQTGREVTAWRNALVGKKTAPAEQPQQGAPHNSKVADMADRRQRKRQTVVNMPKASTRNPAAPEKKEPSAAEHIRIMRRARGLNY